MNIKELLTPGVISIGVTIIGLLIKPIGEASISYLMAKKDDVEQSKFVKDHQKQIATAKEVWGLVDEHFRLSNAIENVMQEKIKMFNDMLLKEIPGLTQDEIDYLRQAIAGEINRGKESLKDDKVKQLQEQLANKDHTIQELQNQNISLNQKLSSISATATVVGQQ